MSIDAMFERLYESVMLVEGRGDRSRGRLCVMSFVALLAGEKHTDHPDTASAVIRNFVVVLNDLASDSRRQTLKPFAAQIVGTNDDLDGLRDHLIVETLFRLEPEIRVLVRRQPAFTRFLFHRGRNGDLERQLDRMLETARAAKESCQVARGLSGAMAQVLSLCVQSALSTDEADRYWFRALDLLDQLCGMRSDDNRSWFSYEVLQRATAEIRSERRAQKKSFIRFVSHGTSVDHR